MGKNHVVTLHPLGFDVARKAGRNHAKIQMKCHRIGNDIKAGSQTNQ
jgi:hypothetical protein